jgi:hypothetical protein
MHQVVLVLRLQLVTTYFQGEMASLVEIILVMVVMLVAITQHLEQVDQALLFFAIQTPVQLHLALV